MTLTGSDDTNFEGQSPEHAAVLQHCADPCTGIGIGLRHPHVDEILAMPVDHPDRARFDWLEVHSENYLIDGGPRLSGLLRLREEHALSCHGVGLSLGSAEGLDPDHLTRLADLYKRVEPVLISDHVSWSISDGHYYNDLLPLPMTEEALDIMARNIDEAQDRFGRTMLVENPSTYIRFDYSPIPEWEFLTALADRTGCGLLLDVNNLFVTQVNHGVDATDYIDRINPAHVGEIHLAGHTEVRNETDHFLIDTHSAPVSDPVWALYEKALSRLGEKPTLVEWDLDIPPLATLLGEADTARNILHRQHGQMADQTHAH